MEDVCKSSHVKPSMLMIDLHQHDQYTPPNQSSFPIYKTINYTYHNTCNMTFRQYMAAYYKSFLKVNCVMKKT